jgi:hypothetical protein
MQMFSWRRLDQAGVAIAKLKKETVARFLIKRMGRTLYLTVEVSK